MTTNIRHILLADDDVDDIEIWQQIALGIELLKLSKISIAPVVEVHEPELYIMSFGSFRCNSSKSLKPVFATANY